MFHEAVAVLKDGVVTTAEITGGVGPDVIVEAAGYPETFNTCFRLVRQFGTIIIFGVQADDFVPNWRTSLKQSLKVSG